MKFQIHGFQQKVAKEMNLSNDDLLVLRWFIDWKETGEMDRRYLKNVNNMGYWVEYSYLIKELPILFSGETERGNKAKVQRILNGNLSKVLVRDIRRNRGQKGSKVFLAINSYEYKKLLGEEDHYTKMCSTTTQKCAVPTTQKCAVPLHKNVQSDTNTNDTNTNDTNTNNTTQFNAGSIENGVINKSLIEKGTHLKITRNQFLKIDEWDKDRLEKAIDIFIDKGGKYFSFLEKIYKDDGNFVPKEEHKGKDLKFNNFEAREYDYDSLEKKLLGWDE